VKLEERWTQEVIPRTFCFEWLFPVGHNEVVVVDLIQNWALCGRTLLYCEFETSSFKCEVFAYGVMHQINDSKIKCIFVKSV